MLVYNQAYLWAWSAPDHAKEVLQAPEKVASRVFFVAPGGLPQQSLGLTVPKKGILISEVFF